MEKYDKKVGPNLDSTKVGTCRPTLAKFNYE